MAIHPEWVATQVRLFSAEGFRPFEIQEWFASRPEPYIIAESTIRGMIARGDKKAERLAKMDKHSAPVRHKPQDITQPTGKGIDIALIGDMQVRPGIPLDYCRWVGEYIAENRPDVIVNIGDFADMPSCSFWEKEGSKGYAEQNYKDDILSVHRGMKALMEPIQREIAKGWSPRLVMCMGNHEDRINRAIEAAPKLDGTIGLPDLEYERWGWEVIPFLEPIEIEGITFSHYFPSGPKGHPINTARNMLSKLHTSAVAGHQQGRDIAFGKRANGKHITAIICGSTYVHDEKYMNRQTNNHWRGMYMLNDCRDGEFEEKAVSMRYLQRKYGA